MTRAARVAPIPRRLEPLSIVPTAPKLELYETRVAIQPSHREVPLARLPPFGEAQARREMRRATNQSFMSKYVVPTVLEALFAVSATAAISPWFKDKDFCVDNYAAFNGGFLLVSLVSRVMGQVIPEIAGDSYPKIRKALALSLDLMSKMSFGVIATQSTGVLLHEYGHKWMAELTLQNISPEVRFNCGFTSSSNPFAAVYNIDYSKPHTAFGDKLGSTENILKLISGGGMGITAAFHAVVMLPLAQAIQNRYPTMAMYLRCLAATDFMSSFVYAFGDKGDGKDLDHLGVPPWQQISMLLSLYLLIQVTLSSISSCAAYCSKRNSSNVTVEPDDNMPPARDFLADVPPLRIQPPAFIDPERDLDRLGIFVDGFDRDIQRQLDQCEPAFQQRPRDNRAHIQRESAQENHPYPFGAPANQERETRNNRQIHHNPARQEERQEGINDSDRHYHPAPRANKR